MKAEAVMFLYFVTVSEIFKSVQAFTMGLWKSFAMSEHGALELLWMPALLGLSWNSDMKALPTLGLCILFIILVNYTVLNFRWYFANKFTKIDEDAGQLPVQYPFLIPWLGNAPSFLWNNANFVRRATSIEGRLTASRISFLGFQIFAFQDRHTIAKIWKQPTLSSPISMFVYVFKYFFGVSESTISVYRADDSGPFPKPSKGSNVKPEERVDYITHHGFNRALGGPGLLPTTKRYMTALTRNIEQKKFTEEWTEMADFSGFFKDVVGSSLVESLYGPTMLQLNPDFMKDLWGFDTSVPWLARAVPSFIRPSAHTPRQNCIAQLKRWYVYAREHFDESHVSSDGDGDPYWGSNLMRYRQKNLLVVKSHDDDALARMDLGLAWGAVGNTIPCAMLSAFHIFKDPILLKRVRNDVENSFGHQNLLEIDPNKLTKEPLLSSIYAETLRLYIKTYFLVSSPHADVSLGRWMLPKGRLGLMNAGISHMDDTFWNSRNGEFPVTTFWADRFIIDPTDYNSGPASSLVRESPDWVEPRREDDEESRKSNNPFFSMDGTEGSWFPYGGGGGICPGRFLAKNAILSICTLLAIEYDIEMLSENVEMDSWRFGLGVGGLKHALPFRIRKRAL